MVNMKKKISVYTICMLASLTMSAHDFVVNDIYYKLNNDGVNTVSVTNNNDQIYSYYSGDIVIPANVEYEGVSYSVTAIGAYAFCRSTGLTSVIVPEGVVRIETYAFGLCSNLTTISIPNSVYEMGSGVFQETPWMANQPDGVIYVGRVCYMYKGEMPFNTKLDIKDGTLGIASNAFSGCEGLSSINMPEGMLYIGSGAFYGCKALTTIQLPNSIKTIGELYSAGAFENCISLTTINIPTSIEKIESQSFMECSSLTTISIPEGATSIGNSAFYMCSNLVSVSIPSTVTFIGESCFTGCSSLTSVKLPEGLSKIESSLFLACSGLSKVNIPQSVESIDGAAFKMCTNLTEIELPDNLMELGNEVFYECKNLKEINIPRRLEKIGYNAFYECYGLQKVSIANLSSWCKIEFNDYRDNPLFFAGHLYMNGEEIANLQIPDDVTKINKYSFSGCNSILSAILPNSITTIGESCFEDCPNLQYVELPENLQIIPKQAFKDCGNLETITIPKTVQFIYQEAYARCYSLSEVKALPTTPPFLFNNAFTEYGATLKVPDQSKESYATTEPWSNFSNIVSLTGDDVEKKTCATPSISYTNGKLSFSCETEDAEFAYEITDADIRKGNGAEIQLTATYNISVYAFKAGYYNSEVATAILCWIDVEPKTDGLSNDIASVRGQAVMVQNKNGFITISGVNEGAVISVYNVSGAKLGTAKANGGQSTIVTNLRKGEVGIIRIGETSFKVMMH